MKKKWLDSYPTLVSAEIGTLTYSSLGDLFQQSCIMFANKPALSNFGTELTYEQFGTLAQQFAAYLRQELKLNKGERFAIMMPNCLQYPIVMFGALLAGLVIVNMNPLYTPRELAFQVKDSGATTLIVLENFAHTVEEALPETNLKNVIVTKLGDLLPGIKGHIVNFISKYVKHLIKNFHLPQAITFKETMKLGKNAIFKIVPITQSDIAFIQYTGGTTGIAKGAILSHGNVLSNIEQACQWFGDFLEVAHETMICALPLYHIFSLVISGFIAIKLGAKSILITNPRDIAHYLKELQKNKFTIMVGVNTLYNAMMNHPTFSKIDFSHLKLAIAGGMALQKTVADRWLKLTGNCIIEGFGLTETSPIIAVNLIDNKSYTGSIGLPVPSTDICVLNDGNQEVGIGEVGELCIKGPQVMQGYWNKPAETEKVFYQGWLRTGDIVKVDEKGFIYIVDRKKDMILVSGFNVYPNELDAVLAACPGVLEAAVIGIPDDRTGEAVKAYIVKKDDALTEENLRAYCKTELTVYKRPKYYEFRDSLPKSPVGKILRRALRDEFIQQQTNLEAHNEK